MGMIGSTIGALFGPAQQGLTKTIEVFRENSEAGAARDAEKARAALEQFAAEFTRERPGMFDRLMDGLNRVPRPAMALGTIGLFAAAMIDPVWFAARMQGIAVVPEPLWWLLGVIVSFYFGARYQVKGQEFKRSLIVASAAETVVAQQKKEQVATAPASAPEANPALAEWKQSSHVG